MNSAGEKTTRQQDCPTYESAIELILALLTGGDTPVVSDIAEITAVGHRVVHGGLNLVEPKLIDASVIATLKELIPLAPLHPLCGGASAAPSALLPIRRRRSGGRSHEAHQAHGQGA
jgi:acetate kinase